MYLLLALLSGIILSTMVFINGELTAQYDPLWASVIIHFVGSLFAFLLYALRKDKKSLWVQGSKWVYLGGVIGIATVMGNNYAFARISMTSIVALGLLGQIVMSLLIDRLGLFGMSKQARAQRSWLGLLLTLLGILAMLDNAAVLAAVFVSFASGISAVLSRTVNARLAEKTDPLRSCLINHLAGLPLTLLLALALAPKPLLATVSIDIVQPWLYTGGMLGVALVLLLNITVPHISAFRITLLTFVGQVFTGILLDVLLESSYSNASFGGGLLVAAGMAVNFIAEKRNAKMLQRQQAYAAEVQRTEAAYRSYILKKHSGPPAP